jgi:hypothetical protein
MRAIFLLTGLALTVLAASQSMAAIVTFNFFGVSNTGDTATGSFSIDDSVFNGSTGQVLSNTNITSLSFTANSPIGPLTFNTADVDASSSEFYNSSVTPFIAVGGSGELAIHGDFVCAMVATALRFSLPMETSLRAISATLGLLPPSPVPSPAPGCPA